MAAMRRWMPLVALAAAVWAAPGSAQTQAEARRMCTDADPEVSFRGCTAMIESGRESGNNLALAFFNRGNFHNRKAQYDQALQDYDQAIRLNPSYDRAYGNRGNVWFRMGQLDRAIADYDECLRLNPSATHIVENRRIALERKAGR